MEERLIKTQGYLKAFILHYNVNLYWSNNRKAIKTYFYYTKTYYKQIKLNPAASSLRYLLKKLNLLEFNKFLFLIKIKFLHLYN